MYIVLTDSSVLSIAEMLAETMRRINTEESVSTMYMD